MVGDPGWSNRVFACVAIELVYYWNNNMVGGNGENNVGGIGAPLRSVYKFHPSIFMICHSGLHMT